ncbi:MAG: hypothetical protein ACJAWS_003047 [Oleiphilaceae bacterium]|jgi:hypothetical protein
MSIELKRLLELKPFFSDEICIVGNASSLLSKQTGQQIDSYQTVIRLNIGFPKHKSSQGSKTDIVGLSCPISYWKYRWYFRRTPIIWMTERRDIIPVWMKHSKEFNLYPLEYWQNLSERLDGKRPSTGVMMVDLICNYIQPRSLAIIGFDFKKSRTLFASKEKLGPHDWEAEEAFVLATVQQGQKDGRRWEII